MCESLYDLNEQLLKYDSYLRVYFGNPKKIINKLIKWTKNYFNFENFLNPTRQPILQVEQSLHFESVRTHIPRNRVNLFNMRGLRIGVLDPPSRRHSLPVFTVDVGAFKKPHTLRETNFQVKVSISRVYEAKTETMDANQ